MRRILLVLVLLAALVAAPTANAWIWPAAGPVLRPFLLGSDRYAGGQHRGVDIGAAAGSPVVAPAGGTVSFAGSIPGGGRALTIETVDGYAVTLLQLGSTSLQRGSLVAEGAVVGVVGESADAVTSARRPPRHPCRHRPRWLRRPARPAAGARPRPRVGVAGRPRAAGRRQGPDRASHFGCPRHPSRRRAARKRPTRRRLGGDPGGGPATGAGCGVAGYACRDGRRGPGGRGSCASP